MSYDPERDTREAGSTDRGPIYRAEYLDREGRRISSTEFGTGSRQPGDPGDDEYLVEQFIGRLDGYTPRTPITNFMLAANILVFIAMVVTGVGILSPTSADLMRWGANFGPLTMTDQWWRLVTCTFVHGGLIHLGFNMWVLKDAGRFVERLYGSTSFLLLYLFSGIGGSLTTIYWNPRVISVGASGAIFGVCGALVAYLIRNRHSLPLTVVTSLRGSITSFLFYNILLGFMIPNIDMGAHLGGLAAGFLAGLILARPLTESGVRQRRWAALIFLVLGPLVLLGVALPLRGRVVKGTENLEKIEEVAKDVQERKIRILKQFEIQRARHRRGDISNEQFARYVEQQILPEWSKLEEQLADLPVAPKKLQTPLNNERELLQKTAEQWKRIIEQLRSSKKPNEPVQSVPVDV
jgi:rhomboid protease GluP